MKIKFEPVAWLTGLAVVIGALLEADRQFEVLPTSWVHWLAFAAAVLALALAGWKVRSAVTPLADPRAANGRKLVPTPPAQIPPGASKFALDPTRE